MLGDRVQLTPLSSWTPPKIPDDVVGQIRRELLPALERYLEPAPAPKIIARTLVLRSHWFMADHDHDVAVAMNIDWARALAPYPFWAIDQACGWWFDTEERKPSGAAIKERCELLVHNARTERDLLRKLLEAQPSQGA